MVCGDHVVKLTRCAEAALGTSDELHTEQVLDRAASSRPPLPLCFLRPIACFRAWL